MSMDKMFPLTDIQLAYVMGRESEFELGGVSTHTYYELDTRLDISEFERALNTVIQNQPMLRAVILDNGKQKILESVPYYYIPVKDISRLDTSEQDAFLSEHRSSMSHVVFPLNKWPMFEFRAIKLNDSMHRLLFSADLLIADGSSMAILAKEVMNSYYYKTCMPLKGQFTDYIDAIKEKKQSARYLKDKEYWEKNADGIPASPIIPLKPLRKGLPVCFTRQEYLLDKKLWNDIKAELKAENITPTVYLMTLYALTLGKWSENEEYTINCTLTDRVHLKEDADRIIGDFTSSVLVPVNFSNLNTHASSALSYIKKVFFGALRHNKFSGVEVLNLLSKQNNSQPVSMPFVFTSLLLDDNFFDSIADIGTINYAVSQTPQVYLDCQIIELQEGLSVTWDYVEDAFDKTLVENMFNFFTSLVPKLSKEYSKEDYLSNDDRMLLDTYNNSAEKIPTVTLEQLLTNSFLHNKSKTAVKCAGCQITYGELYTQAKQLAEALAAEGIGPGDFIGVLAHRNIDTIVQIIAIILSGAAYVPINPEHPKERRTYILNHSGCKLLINEFACDTTCRARIQKPKPNDTAYVIYTSGSTGEPKGVVITHDAVINTILDINQKFGVGSDDVVIGISSFCFDLSVYDIFGTLSAGAALVLVSDARNIPEIFEVLTTQQVTFWNTVPAIMDLLVDEFERRGKNILPYWKSNSPQQISIYDTCCLRKVLLSGDWIPLGLPDRIRNAFPYAEVCSLGGATEASIWSIFYPISTVNHSWASIPYGYPLANQTVYILNRSLDQCPIGVTGEIYIGGRGVALGYQNSPQKTQAAFILHQKFDRLYCTGDYGYMSRDGYIVFQGRRDGQVKIRGHRIELGEIEQAVARHPLIEACTVINRKNRNNQDILCAYYVSRVNIDADTVKQLCSEYLPEYMVPSYCHKIESIPLTSNGKVDKKALPAPNFNSLKKTSVTLPQTPAQKTMHDLWCSILHEDEIDINSSFFEVGGDSVMLVKLVAEIEERFDIKIALKDILYANTIYDSARLLKSHRADEESFRIPQMSADIVNQHQPFPLTDVQMAYYLGRNSHFDLGDVAAHAYYEVEGDFHIPVFQNALNRVIRQQDMLRAVFTKDGTQVILPTTPDYITEVEDLSSLDEQQKEKLLIRQRLEMSHARFDIQKWPLFEFKFIKLDCRKYRLCIGFDLLIADGTSMRILVNELIKVYQNPDLSLEPLSFSFRDYVRGLSKLEDSTKREEDRAYWLGKLDHFPKSPALISADQIKEHTAARRFERLSTKISACSWSAFKNIMKSHHVTPSAALCSLYALLLANHCNQPQLALNVTVFNRYPFHEDIKRMVGDFTALLPVGIDLSMHDDFWIHTETIQRTLIEALDHNLYSGVGMIRELGKKNGLSGSAVLPVVFTSLLFGDEDFSVMRSMGEIVYSISQTPQVYLDCQVMEVGGELSVTWDFAADLLDRKLLVYLFRSFEQLICALTSGSQNPYEHLAAPYGIDEKVQSKIMAGSDIVLNYRNEICPVGVAGRLFRLSRDNKVDDSITEVAAYGGYLSTEASGYFDHSGIVVPLEQEQETDTAGLRFDKKRIEAVLSSLPGVEKAVLNLAHGMQRDSKYLLTPYLISSRTVSKEEIADQMPALAPNIMLDTPVHVSYIPHTKTGETDVLALVQANNRKPVFENQIQAEVYELWKSALEIDDFKLDDNFFSLGGDSVVAIKIYSELQKKYHITIQDMFYYQSVSSFSAFLANCKKQDKNDVIEELRSSYERSKSFPHLFPGGKRYEQYCNSIAQCSQETYCTLDSHRMILLTGSTGYLGSYVLKQLMETTSSTVVLPIRAVSDHDAETRIHKKLNFYFGADYYPAVRHRLRPVKADLTQQGLGIAPHHTSLMSEVSCIIHCAALMSHLASYEDLFAGNVLAVKNVLEFSKDNNHIPLTHISTSQIATAKGLRKSCDIYTEADLYDGQKFEDNYSKSKYEAELWIEEWKKRYPEADIRVARVGNIVFDSHSGQFQENMHDNAFYNLIRIMMQLKVMPQISEKVMEFTYVDTVASAVCAITTSPQCANQRFHIANPVKISMDEFCHSFNALGIAIRLVPFDQFLDIMSDHFTETQSAVLLNELLINIHLFTWFDPDKVYFATDKTTFVLRQLGVEWPEASIKEIKNMYDHASQRSFFEVAI